MFRVPRHPEAFSLDPSRKKHGGRRKADEHLRFIRALPCCICGTRRNVEAAHIRFGSPQHGKPGTPMGEKPDDRWSLPTCADHHRLLPDSQHAGNERAFWLRWGIEPLDLALRLFAASGDEEAAENILRASRVKSEAPGP